MGQGATVPELGGRPRFVPSRGATLAVAAALAGAAVVVLLRVEAIVLPVLPPSASRWLAAGLGAVFVLRSIGDFRLVGFFKSVRNTRFAEWDTWVYSPLCLLLGVGALWLARG